MPCSRLLASLFVAATTLADAGAAPVNVLALDDMTCTAWTSARADAEQHLPYIHWVRGFLSGHNYAFQAKQVSVVSSGTIAAYIDRYCRQRPTGTVTEAAMRMSDDYSGRNSAIRK